ncbi:hypothetical protein [Bradyrhizobium sp. Arg816]|uniref:hypothetical protein n=1 Tax=Bradyrhizobium sp. Arg816 TaxID=2998491 RepID=UPI00249E5AAB|nr:hypothetical protein [Bradyrhizobium sp. Arg816]MDI3567404.1 hypothetical protein [Bradyrhizobium sp. Arg816]
MVEAINDTAGNRSCVDMGACEVIAGAARHAGVHEGAAPTVECCVMLGHGAGRFADRSRQESRGYQELADGGLANPGPQLRLAHSYWQSEPRRREICAFAYLDKRDYQSVGQL